MSYFMNSIMFIETVPALCTLNKASILSVLGTEAHLVLPES